MGAWATVAERWAAEELEVLTRAGLRRQLEPLSSPQGPVVRVGAETLINFSSNDYLGLAADPRLAEAAVEAVRAHGVGSGASRLVVGDTTAHQSLERKLAEFEGAPAALLFNSGYAANVGIITALTGAGDAVFSDALNHASLVDGCRLSRARKVVYPHRDVAALARLLDETPARRKLVVTDGVFSMDGDLAPLAELVALCRSRGAALLVDEAHATGVLGPSGAGLCESLGLSEAVDVRMGTLGKALGTFGAYAVGGPEVIELLLNRARPLVFSTALPAAVCAAAEAALRCVEAEPARREVLWANVHRLAEGLRALGIASEARSAIFPVLCGTPEAAVAVARGLRLRGLLVKAIRPPTVPVGTSRLRIALTAGHTFAQIDSLLSALAELEVRVAA